MFLQGYLMYFHLFILLWISFDKSFSLVRPAALFWPVLFIVLDFKQHFSLLKVSCINKLFVLQRRNYSLYNIHWSFWTTCHNCSKFSYYRLSQWNIFILFFAKTSTKIAEKGIKELWNTVVNNIQQYKMLKHVITYPKLTLFLKSRLERKRERELFAQEISTAYY